MRCCIVTTSERGGDGQDHRCIGDRFAAKVREIRQEVGALRAADVGFHIGGISEKVEIVVLVARIVGKARGGSSTVEERVAERFLLLGVPDTSTAGLMWSRSAASVWI